MSLSSFLLGAPGKKSENGKRVLLDKGLDDIFQTFASTSSARPFKVAQAETSIEPQPEVSPASTKREKKRKLPEGAPSVKPKRSKTESHEEALEKSSHKHEKAPVSSLVSETNSEDEDVARGATKSDPPVRQTRDNEDAEHSNSEDEGLPSRPVHESLLKETQLKHHGSSKPKYVPLDETQECRNARTVFVGNVPVEVAKNRPLQKQFKRHVLSFVPTAKIESVRFRSVAFQNPTSQLPSLDTLADKGKGKSAQKGKEKEARQHDRERAASWRASKNQDEEDSAKAYLTPKEKKRIAFIKQELHEGADTVNAYVVFAHAPPAVLRAANVPPPAPTMDPYEAAKLAALRCDGTFFMERTLRSDRAGRQGGERPRKLGEVTGDPKTTVFVGNLDFASKEEDLRMFFEGLLSAERGPPPVGGDSDDEDEEEDEGGEMTDSGGVEKLRTWVKRVRIVRDKDTQLGKGFAYVHFVDRECVDEILAVEQDRLKFAKRKLRVQRCKTLPGGSKVTTKPVKSSSAMSVAPKRAGAPQTAPIPKGDPTLGTKISHLSKDERKQIKAADAYRVARRLAKKKAKVLVEKGVKSKVDRERVRKRPGEKKAAGSQEKGKKKTRIKSGRALAKMNTKK